MTAASGIKAIEARRIVRIDFTVADLDRTAAFYAALGFEPISLAAGLRAMASPTPTPTRAAAPRAC